MFRGKKAAEDLTMESIIFFIVNLFFFLSLLYFVYQSSSSEKLREEVYAKTLALSIDSMGENSILKFNARTIIDAGAKKNLKPEEAIFVDISQSKIKVRMTGSQGYEFAFFKKIKSAELNGKFLIIKT